MLLQISISEQYLGKHLPKSTVAGHEELASKISYSDQYFIYQSSIIHSVCPKFCLKYFFKYSWDDNLILRVLSLLPSRKTSRNQGSFSWEEGKEPWERGFSGEFIFPRAVENNNVCKIWRRGRGLGQIECIMGDSNAHVLWDNDFSPPHWPFYELNKVISTLH